MNSHKQLFLMASVCALLFSASARAQTTIAVVDMQTLLTESNAAKSIHKQVESQREKFLQELSSLEQDLRKSEQDLGAEQASLSKEDFTKKRQALEEKFMETRKIAQKRKKALDDGSAKAMNKLRDEIYKVVGEIADEKSYDLVISKQNVVIGDKSLDISEAALQKLNKSVSNITLEIDSN